VSDIRYPDIHVQLTGHDGNGFAIMGAVTKALRDHGVSLAELNLYREESMSGDYDHLLATAMAWVDVS
jgi:hypothetical protein